MLLIIITFLSGIVIGLVVGFILGLITAKKLIEETP